MAAISIPKLYANGQILAFSHLEAIRTAIQTFVNITQLTSDNINIPSLVASTDTADAATVIAKTHFGASQSATISGTTVLTGSPATLISLTVSTTGEYLAICVSELGSSVNTVVTSGTETLGTLTGFLEFFNNSTSLAHYALSEQCGTVSSALTNFEKTVVPTFVKKLSLTAGDILTLKGSNTDSAHSSTAVKAGAFIYLYALRGAP